MKKKNILSFLSLAVLAASFVSCEKTKLDENKSAIYVDANGSASVRFIHALSSNARNVVSPVVATTPPPPMNFFVDGVRLNAISTSLQTFTTAYGGAFPGTALTWPSANLNGNNNFDYSIIAAGTRQVAGVLMRFATATPAPSAADTVLSTAINLEAGKRYSVIAADTIPFQRFFAYEDNYSTPDTGNATIRIINLAPNVGTVAAGFDVYSRRRQANVVTGLTYRNASNFIEGAVTTTDTLEFRPTGAALTTTPVANVFGINLPKRRVMTVVIRGVATLAAPRNLAVASYFNR